jgi:adenylate cyclase
VVAGNVGRQDRFEYTVMGATVNKASRLCDAAKQHKSRTLADVGPTPEPRDGWQPISDVTLRGFAHPTSALELVSNGH